MSEVQDGLHVVDADADPEEPNLELQPEELDGDGERESLRDALVDAFNARDLDALLDLVHPEVECPERNTTTPAELAEEVAGIWHRSPGVILTRGFLDGSACAVAWLPDDSGRWSRAAVVGLDIDDGLIRLLDLADDPDALDRVEADDPGSEELDEGASWVEWDAGEELPPQSSR